MTRDALNMPFRRNRPIGGGDTAEYVATNRTIDTNLKAESILLEEFNYISVTAYQIKEQRTQLFNIYLIVVGFIIPALSALATITFNQINSHDYSFINGLPSIIAIVVLVLLFVSLLSFLCFTRILDLSQKYRESIIALNFIKEFYIEHLKPSMPQIERAFYWRLDTIPNFGRISGAAFFMGSTLAIIGAGSLVAAITLTLGNVFNLTGINGRFAFDFDIPPIRISGGSIIVELISFILGLLPFIVFYRRVGKKRRNVSHTGAILLDRT